MIRLVLWSAFGCFFCLDYAECAGASFEILISAGKHDRVQVPVSVPLNLPADVIKNPKVLLKDAQGKIIPAQLTATSLMQEWPKGKATAIIRNQLHFVVTSLKAGGTSVFKATLSSGSSAKKGTFSWHDTKGQFSELRYEDRPVLRYMHEGLDDSTKESRERTYKVFHHIFDPAGKLLLTKGPGGLYTHHRGLFYGFRVIHYGNHQKPVDTWHCTDDTHQSHAQFLAKEAGPVLGRHRVAIAWHGHRKQVFAKEERELTVYNLAGGWLIEFASRLQTTGGTVKLDGDPQHAGFQFRAAQEVAAKNAKQTYYLRPDGKGKQGQTRNWPRHKNHINLPWNAMSFVVGGRRYTAVYLDKPTNPKEARYSERDYGRFGSYFVADVTKEKPLLVNYRIWLQAGEMTASDVKALSANFVGPATVKVR